MVWSCEPLPPRPEKKQRLSVYLDPDLKRRLEDFAERRGQSSSLIAEAAIASFLSPDADERNEAAIGKRLDRIDPLSSGSNGTSVLPTKRLPCSYAFG